MTSRNRLRVLPVGVVALAVGLSAPPATADSWNFIGGPVTIADSSAPPTPAVPYPSTLTASGVSQIVRDVNVSLSSFEHGYPADVDVLLVGPRGQSVILLSDAGGGTFAHASLTFSDEALGSVPDPIVSGGFYKPTNVDDGSLDVFPSPAPLAPFGSALSAFEGVDANGPWSLYVVDDDEFADGTIGSWRVGISGRPPLTVGFGGVDAVGSERTGVAHVYVHRGSSGFAARVGYTTEPLPPGGIRDPATPGSDYTPVSGTLDFAPGETSKQFDVPIVNDRLYEYEGFLVRLTDASGDAALSDSVPNSQRIQTVVIEDDEPAPTTPRISGKAVQRVLRQRGVIMTVRFNLDGTVRASGTIPLPRAAATRSVRLKPVKRSVTAGVPVRLKLRLSRKALRSVRSAFEQRSRLTAKVKVVATDLARTSDEVGTRRFKLKP